MKHDLKKYLAQPDVAKIINELANWYKIDVSIFKQILEEVIIRKIKDDEIALNLEQRLNVDFDTALKIAKDVIKKILAPIRGDLAEIDKKLPVDLWQKYMPNNLVDDFLKQLVGFKLSSANAKKRFEKAIYSWIKDVRDISELKEVLTRSEKVGGVSLPEEIFDQLEKFLMAKSKEIEDLKVDLPWVIKQYQVNKGLEEDQMPAKAEEESIDVSAVPPKAPQAEEKITGEDITIDKLLAERGVKLGTTAPKEPPKFSAADFETALPQTPLAKEIEAKEELIESKEELAPPAPAPIPPKRPAPPPPKAPTPPPARPVPPVQPHREPSKPLMQKTAASASNRPRVEDVKFATKLYGPIDELAALSLSDFRRLSKDPDEAANKISTKLDLLEDESLVKRIEGIKALKSSPLYKIYAEIMNQAIKEGKSIEQILKQNTAIGLNEFQAIMKLNKSLKY